MAGWAQTGCWDRVEVNDLAMVDVVGVDTAPAGKVRVTVDTMLPIGYTAAGGGITAGGTGSQGPSNAVATAEGDTISQAVDRIQRGLPQRLFYGDLDAVVVGDAYARAAGITPVVDFLLRSRTARLSVTLFITPGDAAALLQTSPPYTSLPGQALSLLGRLRLMPSPEFYRLAQVVAEPGRGAILPEVVAQTAAAPTASGGQKGQDGQTPQASAPRTLAVVGAALLNGPFPVSWMTADQAHGAMWLTGDVLRQEIVVATSQGGRVTCTVSHSAVRRHAVVRDGRVAVIVTVNAAATIRDYAGPPIQIDDPKVIADLDRLLAGRIRREMAAALALTQAQGVDAFGFGRMIAAERPRQWAAIGSQWRENFSALPVILQVTAYVRRRGDILSLQSTAGTR